MKSVFGSLSVAILLFGATRLLNAEFVVTELNLDRRSSAANAAYSATVTSLAPPQRANVERVNVALIALTPSGFDPPEIIGLRSPFVLSVDNRTGLQDMLLILTDQAGNKVRETRLLHRRKWKEVMDLRPGRYVLIAAENPDWICHITVTP